MEGLVENIQVDGINVKSVGLLSKNQFEITCFDIAVQLGG